MTSSLLMGGSHDVTDALSSSASEEPHNQALHSDTLRTPSCAGERLLYP